MYKVRLATQYHRSMFACRVILVEAYCTARVPASVCVTKSCPAFDIKAPEQRLCSFLQQLIKAV